MNELTAEICGPIARSEPSCAVRRETVPDELLVSAALGPGFAAERAERLWFVLAQRARPTLERMVDRPVLAHQPGEVPKPVLDDLRRMDVHGRAGRVSTR